jgi:hypothetical protein
MQIKAIEIRDRNTAIPAVAIRMTAENEQQRYLMARVGFRGDGVILMRLTDQEAHSDPYSWRGDTRTMPSAHVWLEEHFDQVAEGDVVDVEFIRGETASPKTSERYDEPVDRRSP